MERWTTACAFRWSPIITFEARVPRFLEWVESECQPIGFAIDAESVGLAFEHPALRMIISRVGFTIEDGIARPDQLEPFRSALAGVMECFAPRALRLESYAAAWSKNLEHSDYEAQTRAFAKHATRADETPTVDFTDASSLADFQCEGFAGQVEWGIVEPDELLGFLNSSLNGRLSQSRPPISGGPEVLSRVGAVSLFVDTVTRPARGERVQDVTGIFDQVSNVDTVSHSVAQAVATGLVGRKDLA